MSRGSNVWNDFSVSLSLFQAPVTMLNLAGYIFCCAGVAVYNYQKLQKMKKKEKKALAEKGSTDIDVESNVGENNRIK